MTQEPIIIPMKESNLGFCKCCGAVFFKEREGVWQFHPDMNKGVILSEEDS